MSKAEWEDDQRVLDWIYGVAKRRRMGQSGAQRVHDFLETVFDALPPHEEGDMPGCRCVRCGLVSVIWWLEDETNSDDELGDEVARHAWRAEEVQS